MPFDFTCLHCGGKMEVSRKYGKIQCTSCGKFMDGTEPTPDMVNPHDAANTNASGQSWTMGGVLYRGEMSPWLDTLVSTLRTNLYEGDRKAALRTCERLLDMEREFLDAHLWIAKLHPDEAVQREHLEQLLALSPRNIEAQRMLLVLNGEITAEEAVRAADHYHDNVQETADAVESDTESLLCPICRGTLTVTDEGGVECAFCGYADATADRAVKPNRDTSLAVAMIKQRGKAVRWKVGERMVHCHECGAERVLPQGKMSSRCPFCNSMNVVVEDVLGAFRQPDALVKFRVRKSSVEQMIEEQLDSRMEKLKGWFIQNKVKEIRYQGVFLPYWLFDIFGEVIVRDDFNDKSNHPEGFERWEEVAQLQDAHVPAVKSPPRAMLEKIGRFDMRDAVGYSPKLLSKFAAELYTVDFDRASLLVRDVFRRAMTDKYPDLNPNVKRTLTTRIDHMDMKLVLMPVWVVTLIEVDEDVRTALVNGQTGKLVMGRAQKT